MSFAALEESTQSGVPVELYTFGYAGGTFRYTSADIDIDFNGSTYTQQPGLSRTAVDDTGEIAKSNLTITAPEDFTVSALFEVYPPSDVVELIIYRAHTGDLTEAATIWIGRVLSVVWSVGSSQLSCESIFSRLRQPGLRRPYARNCPHQLYGAACRAQETLFQQVVTLNGLEAGGFDLTSPDFDAQADGYFAGGKLTFELSPGVIERRGIRAHTGDTITLTHPITGLLATSTVTVSPGCPRTQDVCVSRFNNLVNFGGFKHMPAKNPFGSNSVF